MNQHKGSDIEASPPCRERGLRSVFFSVHLDAQGR
jgi:hypothetical protein